MVELKAQVQEALRVGRDVGRYWGLRAERTDLRHVDVSHPNPRGKREGSNDAMGESYLEDGLHLVELSPGVFSREHLDDQTPDAPYVGLLRVCHLLDDFGSHPIDRALERRAM